MINSRHINKLVALLLILAVTASAMMVYGANVTKSIHVPEYQMKLFNGKVATIDIRVDDDEWQNLINNASAKEFVTGDLIINGELFSSVGIRTKGNSSLSQVVSSDSDRYSLQFKMNYSVKGQTYYGLDTFCVNNLMGDATYMKDIISYDIMKFIGVDTPLTGYAKVTVNGEDYGFCLLLERYDKAFLDRVYDTSAGNLYNVKIQMGQRDNFIELGQAGDTQTTQTDQTSKNNTNQNQPGNRGMGGLGGSNGGSLEYTNDELSSYSSIFDNAIFSSTSESDMQKVVTAIKNLNDGTNLEQYWNVDEILKYFAVHTFVVNLDSYVSSMQQNYYIYERDGKITILPWDYGLSFGGFQSGNASSVVNFPIDTPVSGVNMEDRPLLDKLLEIDEYKEKYHNYLQQIVDGYVNSGLFEETVNKLDNLINGYVKNDTTAFFTYDKYTASLPVFIELVKLRAESVAGQLNGTIPSTTSGQQADSSALIDSSNINLSSLGSMNGGGGGFNGEGNTGRNRPSGNQNWSGGQPQNRSQNNSTNSSSDTGAGENQDSSEDQAPDNIQNDNSDGMTDGMPPPDGMSSGGQPPGQGFSQINPTQDPSNVQDLSNGINAVNNDNKTNIIVSGMIMLVLLSGIIFLKFYKRRKMLSC